MSSNPTIDRQGTANEQDSKQNDNWTSCKQCGAKLFVDPDTGEAEPCATCKSRSMKSPLVGGVAFISLAAFIVVMILATAVYMLVQYS